MSACMLCLRTEAEGHSEHCFLRDVEWPLCGDAFPLTVTKYAAHIPVAVCSGCDRLDPECICPPPRVSQPSLRARLSTGWLALRWRAARALTRALGIEPASLSDQEDDL